MEPWGNNQVVLVLKVKFLNEAVVNLAGNVLFSIRALVLHQLRKLTVSSY